MTDTIITGGLDIGKLRDPSALVWSEALPGDRHVVHRLRRFALDTPYPQLEREIGAEYAHLVEVLAGERRKAEHAARGSLDDGLSDEQRREQHARSRIWVLADASGCGTPVCDSLAEGAGIARGHLCAVQLTAGYALDVRRGSRTGSCSKSYLVSRLRTVIGTGRLTLPDTDEARALLDELADFEMQLSDQGTPSWNARPGSHDDLLCALALAVLLSDQPQRGGAVKYA